MKHVERPSGTWPDGVCGVLRGFFALVNGNKWKVLLWFAIVGLTFPVAAYYGAMVLGSLCNRVGTVAAWWWHCLVGVNLQLWIYWFVVVFLLVCVLVFWAYRVFDSWVPRKWQGLAGNGCRQGLLRQERAWRRGDLDCLSRHDFVQVLKLIIRNAPCSDGAQYIGLYGAWGEGKTSVINMLKARSDEWPFLFVDFSPWNHASSSSYASVLFDEIAAQMPFRFFDPLRRLLRSFGRMMSVKGERLIGGYLVECTIDIVSWLAELFDVKKRLCERLDGFGRRIVVVIDDMDRLPPKDVYEVIRVIKANGDLPNVTYLLSADKDYLSAALATELQIMGGSVCEGRRYLEKIVQTECPLPPIDRADIECELLGRANEIPRRYIPRIGEIKREGLSDVVRLVKNLRDVLRVVNVFEVDVAIQARKLGMRSSMDVHMEDLLTLSVLKVFCLPFVRRLHASFNDWVYQSKHPNGDVLGRSKEWVDRILIGEVSEEVRMVLMAFLEKRMRMRMKLVGATGKEVFYVLDEASLPEGLKDYRLFSQFAFENYFSTKKGLLPVRQKLYRKFVGRLNAAPLDDVFLANVVRNHLLYPILFILDAETAAHSRRWVENFVASFSKLADLDLSTACERGDSVFCANDDAYSALYDSVQRYLQRWVHFDDFGKEALSKGLGMAGSFQLRARLVSENLYAFHRGAAEDSLLPLETFQNHVDALLDIFALKEKSGEIRSFPNKTFLRTIWCRVVREIENQTRDAEFKSAMKGALTDAQELVQLLETFLTHDAHEFRIMAFDLKRAEKLFDLKEARGIISDYERANDLVDYVEFALRLKELGEPIDIKSQFDILRNTEAYSPALAIGLIDSKHRKDFHGNRDM